MVLPEKEPPEPRCLRQLRFGDGLLDAPVEVVPGRWIGDRSIQAKLHLSLPSATGVSGGGPPGGRSAPHPGKEPD